MEVLNVLEQKFASLVKVVERLKEDNKKLHSESETLQFENADLKKENAKLAEESAQLSSKLEAIEVSSIDSGELERLHEEKKRTKELVDDLIKNIESLVDKENQL